MINFIKKFLPKIEMKSVGGTTFFFGLRGRTTNRDRGKLAAEGYLQNPVAYKCIDDIACGGSTIDLVIIDISGEDIKVFTKHKFLDFLRKPSPVMSQVVLLKRLLIDFVLFGEYFILDLTSEIMPITPLNVIVIPGLGIFPKEYVINQGMSNEKTIPVDQLTGKSDMLHVKKYNPLDPWRGLSPLVPGATAIDIVNEALKFNYSLLRNGGRPSLALTTDQTIPDVHYAKLKESIRTFIQGAENAGEVPILERGLNIHELSKSPRDLDFIDGVDMASRMISLVCGVPFVLISPDASTFANIKEAREMLYENTIVPTLNEVITPLGNFLLERRGLEGLFLAIDLNSVDALEPRRERKFDRVVTGVNKGLMTIDEGRQQIGLEPVDGGDEILIPGNLIPLDLVGLGEPEPEDEPEEEEDAE